MDIKTTKNVHDADSSFLAHVPKIKIMGTQGVPELLF